MGRFLVVLCSVVGGFALLGCNEANKVEEELDDYCFEGDNVSEMNVTLGNTQYSVNCDIFPLDPSCQIQPIEVTKRCEYEGPEMDESLLLNDFDGSERAIREATLVNNIDGDTTRFNIANVDFQEGPWEGSVRYLGINTPEISTTQDAWGKAAANYTTHIINNSTKYFVEILPGIVEDTYGRMLGYVWIEFEGEYRLLNYMVVKEGYSNSTGSEYQEEMLGASNFASDNNLHEAGDTKDPCYDYLNKKFLSECTNNI